MGANQYAGPTIDDWSSVLITASESGLPCLDSPPSGSFILGDNFLTSSAV